MKIINLIVVLFLVSLVGCNQIKLIQILKSGEVKLSKPLVKIPFTYKAGLINLPVTIEGVKYNFMFDTGASNTISTEIFRKHNFKSNFTSDVTDSGGKSKKLIFTKIPKLSIQEANFFNFGSAVQDMENSVVFKCLDFDGIIGANLFREFILEINYKNQYLAITQKENLLELPDETSKIEFTTNLSGSPKIDVAIEGLPVSDITFDTGSNGSLKILNDKISTKIKEKNQKEGQYSYGVMAYGIHGKQDVDTTCQRIVEYLSIGNQKFNPINVLFQNTKNLIGNEVLKNFQVFINWQKNEIFLDQHTNFENKEISNFGFDLEYSEGNLVVSTIYLKSEADKKGMQIGDRILAVNDVDYSNFNEKDYCSIILGDEYFDFFNEKKLKVKIFRKNKKMEFILIP